MADRVCIHCEDRGDCYRCSWYFEKDKIHSKCGRRWGDHEVKHQEFYAPWAECPPSLIGQPDFEAADIINRTDT